MVYVKSLELSASYQQQTWLWFFLSYPSHLCHVSGELTFPSCCKSSPDPHEGLPALSRARGASSKARPHMAPDAFGAGRGLTWSLHLPSHTQARPRTRLPPRQATASTWKLLCPCCPKYRIRYPVCNSHSHVRMRC